MAVATVTRAAESPAQVLARRLRAKRQAAGLRWYELAIAAGVSPSLISKWEAGRGYEPQPDALARVARALGTSPAALTDPSSGEVE